MAAEARRDRMNLFQALELLSAQEGLDFLVIGGHAINYYGYSRETFDIDILTEQDSRPRWISILATLGYTSSHEHGTFVQYDPSPQYGWPLDLMFVNAETWRKLRTEAVPAAFGPAQCKVPKVQHLIALKLHALKHTRVHRFLKDFQDVVGLIQINHLDMVSAEMQELFSRYGTPELYSKVARACSAD
jgi:hypothetical protein